MPQKLEDLTKEQLLDIINKQKEKLKNKKYGLVWDDEKEPEKIVVDCQNNVPILKDVKSKEISSDNGNDNILIEGDNYHALTCLNYTHKGKIDVIYIDPPYNTGGDWKYNDRYVDKEDAFRHSKWLNMMEKRLALSRNLLKDNGVIFISIDEHEQANLKLLCDKIFGEDNFLSNFIWQKKSGGGQAKYFYEGHEYISIYIKNKQNLVPFLKNKELSINEKKIIVENGKWYYMEDDFLRKVHGKYKGGVERRCHYEDVLRLKGADKKREIDEGIKKGIYDLLKDKNTQKHFVRRKTELIKINNKYYKKTLTYSLLQGIWNSDGTTELENIFAKNTFENPKPTNLVKELVSYTNGKELVVLDFFAGSGTTGHAVLELNKEDGGNRKFILCTNNEGNICTEVCYPRLSKVIKGYKKNGDGEDVKGLGGNLKYLKTDLIPVDRLDNVSDRKRVEITKNAGEMIGLKEDTLEQVELNNFYQILSNKKADKFTAIYFRENEEKLEELIKKIGNKKTVLYVFSYGKVDRKMYKGLAKNITIEDIPEPIIEIYREINLKIEDK